MILDCHMHSWEYPEDFNREVMLMNQPERRRDWPDEKFKKMWNLPVEDYFDEFDGRVDKALLVGLTAGESLGIEVRNSFLADMAAKYPERLVWACCLNPTDAGAADEASGWVQDQGAVAIGELSPAYGNYRLDDERCFPLFETARDLDVPIVIHAGPVQARFGRLKYADITAVDEVAIQFPDLRIVICHLGYPKYEEATFLLGKHENVYADVSWMPQLAGIDRRILSKYLPSVTDSYFHMIHPLLYYYSQTFGRPGKLLWGSDFPAGSQESLDAFLNINSLLEEKGHPTIPDDLIEAMLHETWKEVFTKVT